MADMQSWHLTRLLSTAARLVEHAWNEQISGLGLTHAGVIALEILAENGPAAQTILATRARVQPQTMGKTLSKLATSGYVTRERTHGDGRSQQVTISDLGRSALAGAQKLQRALAASQAHAAGNLNEDLAKIIQELAATPNPTTPRSLPRRVPESQYRDTSS